MRFGEPRHYLTGTAVPVFSLRGEDGAGVGEFADLKALGSWCASTGLDLIQILPVNDTGFERSPYSALSAFALHPLFVRLQDVPESAGFGRPIGALRKRFAGAPRLDYAGVLTEKLGLLEKMWRSRGGGEDDEKDLEAWELANGWAKDYALFSLLRRENGLRSWMEWTDHRDPSAEDLDALWAERRTEARFWTWMQWRLETQLKDAARALDGMGVALKGDIPILINDDSADVWAHRGYFRLDLRAGAPPDHYAVDGQNWGFPTYDWEALRKDGFAWWRRRLSQASKFYHAYRIDHVLGFFRIWAIPSADYSAVGGRFEPSAHVREADLREAGFDDGRIAWLSRAHVSGSDLREAFGPEADAAAGLLEKVPGEDLWRSRPDGGPYEREIRASALGDAAKDRLIHVLRNRTFRTAGAGLLSPDWSFRSSRGWASLDDGEREALEEILDRCHEASEALWEDMGRELLAMMKGDGSMLVCAEDLGVVPDCVPRVLADLGILGLKVTRWARSWGEDGDPYEDPRDYPYLSVSTCSVHDSTTLRQWLRDEPDEALGRDLFPAGGFDPASPTAVRDVLGLLQDGASLLAVHPLQDLMALEARAVSADPAEERINVPGEVSDGNWSWRMGVSLEDLPGLKGLRDAVSALAARRGKRALPAKGPVR